MILYVLHYVQNVFHDFSMYVQCMSSIQPAKTKTRTHDVGFFSDCSCEIFQNSDPLEFKFCVVVRFMEKIIHIMLFIALVCLYEA